MSRSHLLSGRSLSTAFATLALACGFTTGAFAQIVVDYDYVSDDGVVVGTGSITYAAYGDVVPIAFELDPDTGTYTEADDFIWSNSTWSPNGQLLGIVAAVTDTAGAGTGYQVTIAFDGTWNASVVGPGTYSLNIPDADGDGVADSIEAATSVEPGVAFVTVTRVNGAFGGFSAADAICEAEAFEGELGSDFVAWLSDSTLDARDRIVDQAYQTSAGTLVANDVADLTDGAIGAAIAFHARPEAIIADLPWTGTVSSGVAAVPNNLCVDWSDESGLQEGFVGDTSKLSKQWTALTVSPCIFSHPLLCFGGGSPALDPAGGDTDGDGSCDGPVAIGGVCDVGEDLNANGLVDPDETDPRNPDTDEDGVPDGIEPELTFDPEVVLSSGQTSTPEKLAIADLDADGDLDLLVARWNSARDFLLNTGTFGWHENDATATYHVVSKTLGGLTPDLAEGGRDIEAADLDGDGLPDVIGAYQVGNGVVWYPNNAGGVPGAFSPLQSIGGQSVPLSLATGDLDQDGDVDVVSGGFSTIVLWDNDLAGSGAFSGTSIPGVQLAYALETSDLDLDGDLDVALLDTNGGRLLWLENDPTDSGAKGSFGPLEVIALDGATSLDSRRLSVGDIDRDGDPDIIKTGVAGGMSWFENPVGETPTNLVVNGNFDVNASGWTIGGGTPGGVSRTGYTGGELTFSGGDSPNDGTAQQVIATTPGQTYSVTYRIGRVGNSDPHPLRVALFDGSSPDPLVDTPLASAETDPPPGNLSATSVALDFVATSSQTTFHVSDQSTNTISVDAFIDDIRVESNWTRHAIDPGTTLGVHLVDVDADGDLDVAFGSGGTGGLFLRRNQGGSPPVFGPREDLGTSWTSVHDVVSLTRAGDGIDLVASSDTGAVVSLFDGLDPALVPDRDGDGLCDGGRNLGETCAGGFEDVNGNGVVDAGESSPDLTDSDGDGLCDGDLVVGACSGAEGAYGTNPASADTDGDGIDDGAEVAGGSDPNDPNSPPPPSVPLMGVLGRLLLIGAVLVATPWWARRALGRRD